MKKIGIIINPNAKKFRTGKDSVDSFMKYSTDNIIISSMTNSADLKEIVYNYKTLNPDYICIAGGDGTIHLVITELINIYNNENVPPVLILKEGTMDNIAHTLKLKGRGHVLLKKFLKKITADQTIQIEDRFTIKISDKYCFLFGTGFTTNFLKKVYSGKEKGFYRNIQVTLMCMKEVFLKMKKYEIFKLTEQAIFIDDKKVLINPVAGILAGTVEHIGMGFSPLIDAVQKNGTFQILVIGMTPRAILRNLNKFRTGKKVKSPKYLNTHGKAIILKQKGVFDYTMDGEIYSAKNELKISTGPKVKLVKI